MVNVPDSKKIALGFIKKNSLSRNISRQYLPADLFVSLLLTLSFFVTLFKFLSFSTDVGFVNMLLDGCAGTRSSISRFVRAQYLALRKLRKLLNLRDYYKGTHLELKVFKML